MMGRRALICVLVLAPLLPIAFGLGQVLVTPFAWGPAGGDFAVLEIHLMDFARLKHLLGPYSRFGWNHPGPLYYAALLPLYWASGGASVSLYVSAAAIALGAASASIATFFRERLALRDRVLFTLAFAAIVLDLYARRLPSDPWNPMVTILPCALFWLVCARVAAASVVLLPAAVLLHAFIVQTHISYLPCASAVLLTATVLGVYHRRVDGARVPGTEDHAFLRALLLGGLVWLPTVLYELGPNRSNLLRIVGGFTGAKSKLHPLEFAFSYGSTKLHAPLLHLGRFDEDLESLLAAGLSVLQYVLLTVGLIFAHRRKERFAFAGCVLSLVALSICLWSCRHLGPVSKQHYYLTLWFAVVGVFGWLSIALALLPAPGREAEPPKWQYAASGVVALLVGVLAVLNTRSMWSRYEGMTRQPKGSRDRLAAAVERVGSLLLHTRESYVLRVGEGKPWDNLAGIVRGLRKQGLSPVLAERWRDMFGNGFDYAAPDSATIDLTISKHPTHGAPLLDMFGPRFYIYREPRAMGTTARLSVDATGNVGRPEWIVDGWAPPPGAPSDSSSAVALADESQITIHLPGLILSELDAVVEGTGGYLLEGSEDGASFRRVAEIPPMQGPGMRSAHVCLGSRGPWRALRLSPLGSGPHAVAEVSLDTTVWGLSWVASTGIVGDGHLAIDGNTPPRASGRSRRGAVAFKNRSSSMTFLLPKTVGQDMRVEGLSVTAGGNDEYEVSGSYDGSHFERIGIAPVAAGKGLRNRSFFFNDGRSWSFVRIAPARGDGRFVLAEVSPLVASGRIIDFGSDGLEAVESQGWSRSPGRLDSIVSDFGGGRLQIPLTGAEQQLAMMLELADGRGSDAVRVSLDGVLLGELPLSTERQIYTLELPTEPVRAKNELSIVPSSKRGTSKPGAARVRLHSIWFIRREPGAGEAAKPPSCEP